MKIIFFTLLAFTSFTSCTRRTPIDSHGLDLIEIRMDGSNFGEMNRSPLIKVYYPGKAKVNEKTYAISMQPAGNSTVRESKKNWDLKFTQDQSPFGAEEVRLGANFSDPSMLRSVLSIEVFRAAGLQPTSITPVFVTLNDLILGLYYRIEKTDGHFFKVRNIEWERLYEARNNGNFAPDMVLRLETAYEGKPKPANLELIALLTRITQIQSDTEFEDAIFQILDRDFVVKYLSASLITNHFDGFQKNLFLYESKGNRVRISPWDFDLDWVGDQNPKAPPKDPFTPWQENRLFSRMAQLPSIKAAVATETTDLLNGDASFTHLQEVAVQYQNQIRAAYGADPFLGGLHRSLDAEASSLLQTIQQRLQQLPSHL